MEIAYKTLLLVNIEAICQNWPITDQDTNLWIVDVLAIGMDGDGREERGSDAQDVIMEGQALRLGQG